MTTTVAGGAVVFVSKMTLNYTIIFFVLADNSKTFKKPKTSSSSLSSTPSSTTSTVSLPTLAVPHHRRSSTEKPEVKDKVKKTGEKSLFESLSESIANKEMITGSKVSHHRKSSVDSGSAVTQSPHLSSEYDSE